MAPDPGHPWRTHPELRPLVERLVASLGDRLVAVLLYGPAARGEAAAERPELNVLVVLRDLELATLARAGAAVEKWLKRGQPFPRLVTPASLADAADVFPIELSEIAERHVVLHGALPALPAIDPEDLRLQCERELREKLMRLHEAYAVGSQREPELRQLMVASVPTFAALVRACLRIEGRSVPDSSAGAFEAFCARTAIDPAPFLAVDQLRTGITPSGTIASLFAGYHDALERAVRAVDQFVPAAAPSSASLPLSASEPSSTRSNS